jgi:hypothetical protein
MSAAIAGFEYPGCQLDCFVDNAPLRKRFAFVAGNDG